MRASLLFSIALMCGPSACTVAHDPPADGAGPLDAGQDGVAATKLELEWDLLSAYLSGGTNNGFAVKCDALPPVTVLTLRVEGGAGARSTAVACPAGAARGVVAVDVPDGIGPYVISGVAEGRPSSVSERVRDVRPTDAVSLRIYLDGCDQPACR
jgi:hypothetical protein